MPLWRIRDNGYNNIYFPIMMATALERRIDSNRSALIHSDHDELKGIGDDEVILIHLKVAT